MADQSDPHSSAILAAFLDRFLADQSRGDVKPLSEYCAAFPGHDEVIAERYEQLVASGGEGNGTDRRVGQYRLLEEIGRGGQGEVHLAFDLKLERQVALKVLPRLDVGSRDVMARFRREAAIASRLDHPAIATVYDSGVADGVPYIAMRYVKGESLAQRIRQAKDSGSDRGLLNPISHGDKSEGNTDASGAASGSASVTDLRSRAGVNATVYFIEQAAHAVHAAHEAGIIHRDLKPGNIMVTPQGRPVILDFGLARDLGEDQLSFTQSGDLFGTPHYMSPEQLAANRVPLDARTDIYSLALSLYEALTFERPFDAPTREGVYQAVLTKQPPDPRKFNSSISDDLRVVLATALEKDRDRRYESAAAFADDLQCVRKNLPIKARPIGIMRRTIRWVRREPITAGLLATLLILAAGVGYALNKWPADRRARVIAERVDREQTIESALARGFQDLHNSEWKAAARTFESALAIDATLTEAVAGLALTHAAAHDFDEALATLDRHRPLSEEHLGLRVLRQSIRSQLGQQPSESISPEALQKSEDPVTWFVLAMEEIRRGHDGDAAAYERAVDLLEQCIFAAPQNRPLYRNELAHAVGHLSRPDQALKIANAMRARNPKMDPLTRYWYAFLLHRSHSDLALEPAEQLVKDWPDRSASHQLYGTCLINVGRLEEAVAALQRARELQPNDYTATHNLVVALTRLDRTDEALAVGREALRRFPSEASISKHYGMLLSRTGDTRAAVRILAAVVKKIPNDRDMLVDLAHAYRKLGKHTAAGETFLRLANLEPDDPRWLVDHAEQVRNAGDAERALELLADAARKFPHDAGAHAARGFTLTRLRRYPEAAEAWDQAVALDDSKSRFFYDRGIALYRTNRFADAVASFERSTELDGEYPEAHCNLGHAYRKVGDFAKAKAAYERAHALGTRRGDWKQPTKRYIRDAIKLARQQRLLARIEEGGAVPSEAAALAPLTKFAFDQGDFATAALLFEELFRIDPSGPSKPHHSRRFNAAGAAIRAARGFRKAANLSLEDRLDFRRRAYDWLRADVDLWKAMIASSETTPERATTWLARWKGNPAFAVVRDDLDRLPEDVAARWSAVWETIDRLLESVKQR